jgi:hypothetical protein
MNIFGQIAKEIISLFIDDGSLALSAVLLIAVVSGAVKFAAMPPLVGGTLLVLGCVAILTESVHRATRQR